MMIKTHNLGRVVDLGEKLLRTSLLMRVDADVFDLAWKIFGEQSKPALSFTDCTSAAVCRVNGISDIATFDRDFDNMRELNRISS